VEHLVSKARALTHALSTILSECDPQIQTRVERRVDIARARSLRCEGWFLRMTALASTRVATLDARVHSTRIAARCGSRCEARAQLRDATGRRAASRSKRQLSSASMQHERN